MTKLQVRRHWVPAVTVAALLASPAVSLAMDVGKSAATQPAPVSAPAQQVAPAPEADRFKFTSEAAAIIWIIKPSQTEAFELVWSVIRSRLAASPKPELKALAESLKIYKADAPPGPEGVTYFFVANPVSKVTSYGISPFLLYDSGLFERPEADELFKSLQDVIIQITALPLGVVK